MPISADRAEAKMGKGEMISTQEAKISTWIGYSMIAFFVALNYVRPLASEDQQTFAGVLLAASGVMFYQMGRDSQ